MNLNDMSGRKLKRRYIKTLRRVWYYSAWLKKHSRYELNYKNVQQNSNYWNEWLPRIVEEMKRRGYRA